MIKNKLQQILDDSKVQQKLKELGENPDNLKASKDSLVIIYDDKTYEIKMVNTLTHKRKRGPKEPRTSKLDLILKRLDTMDNRFDKIEHRLDKVESTLNTVVQRVNFIGDKLNKVIVKNNLKV